MEKVQTSEIDFKTLVEAIDPQDEEDEFPIVYEFEQPKREPKDPYS